MRFGRIALACALALGYAAPAAADPVSILGLVGAFLAGSKTVWIAVVGWGLMIGSSIYGSAQARRKARAAEAAAKAAYNASLSDQFATILSADPDWRTIYGRKTVGCDIVAIFTSNTTGVREDGTTYTRADALKHLVVHIASHECKAVHDVFIDGIALGPLDGNGIPTTTGEFRRVSQHGYVGYTESAGYFDLPGGLLATSIMSAYTGYITVNEDTLKDVTASCAITNGGARIIGPQNAVVTYMCDVVHWSVRVSVHLGTDGQTVDTYLNSVVPSQWDSNHRGRGRCYAVVTLNMDENVRFQGGPPGITFDVSGRLLYDPRSATTYWTDNAALCQRDFLLAPWGFNTSSAGLDATTWNAAANDSDARLLIPTSPAVPDSYKGDVTADAGAETITFAADKILNTGDGVRFTTTGTLPAPLATSTTYYIVRQNTNARRVYKLATTYANALAGTTINITSTGSGVHTCTLYDYAAYTINGLVFGSESKESMLEQMARAMAGSVTNIGRWYAFAGTWHTSVMDLGDDDLDGSISLPNADTDLDNLINGQRGQFIPAGWAVPVDYDPYQNATYKTADGEDLFEQYDMRFTNTRYRCRNISRIFVEQNRSGQQLVYPAKLKAIQLQPGDRVRVSSTELGLTNQYYRVTDTQWGYKAPVLLSLIEDGSAIWDTADATVADQIPNTGLSSPYIVSQVTISDVDCDATTGMYGSDGSWTPRALVWWTAITDPYMDDANAKVWIGWRAAWEAQYTWVAVPPGQLKAYIQGFAERVPIVIQVYAENSMEVKGPPSYYSLTVPFTQSDPNWIADGTGARTSGDIIWKDSNVSGVTAGWNASIRSRNSIIGACRAKAVVLTTTGGWMFGLNSDPATDASYTSIDYAIYQTSSAYEIYESGSLIYNPGSPTPAVGDVLEVIYTGSEVRYMLNGTVYFARGAPSGLQLAFDSSLNTIGTKFGGVEFSSLTVAPRGNLVNSDVWTIGTITANPYPSSAMYGGSRFYLNETNSGENAIVMGEAPDGALRPLWKCGPAAGTAGADADGGFIVHNAIPIDESKTYRASMWIKIDGSAALDGSWYFGPAEYGSSRVATISTGVADINPYFHAGTRGALVPNRWYFVTGFVFPSNFGTSAPNPTAGAVYDGTTGERVASAGNDFKWYAGNTVAGPRGYQYYTSNGAIQYFWAPRFEMCDGNEPTVQQLMASALERKAITYDNEFDAAYGLNGDFNRWPITSTYPTGWSLWANANGLSKETSTVASGPNAIRMVTGGNDTGVYWEVSFASAARPVIGSYIEVTVAAYVVSSTSGAQPQVLVRLYTNSGLTTYRDTFGAFSTAAVGWQNMTLNAAVASGETIYGIEIFLMGSWTGGVGAWTGTVVFDKVFAKVKQPKDTDQLVYGSVTANFTSSNSGSGLGWTNSSSEYDPIKYGTRAAMLSEQTITYGARERYLVDIQCSAIFSPTGTVAINSVKVTFANGYRDYTSDTTISVGEGIPLRVKSYNVGSTAQEARAICHFTTLLDPVSLGWTIGHQYKIGGLVYAVQAFDASGSAIAPGSTASIYASNFMRVSVFKA